MEHPRVRHSGRSIKIDVLRGGAVIGMIAAHALFFFHNGSNAFLLFIEKFLNMSVFTLFVFVYGQALSKWLDEHAHEHSKRIWILSLKRAVLIYFVYAITSLGALITSKGELSQLISVLTLASAPSFTEYMQLFIVLAILTPILRLLFRYTRSSLLLTFITGGFFYLLGVILYEIPVPAFLVGLKAIFIGHEEILRFPVFLYLPVVLWGLWWQHDADHNIQDKAHTRAHLGVLIGMVFVTVFGIFLIRFANVPLLNPDIRWPPSIAFLTMGISVAAISLFLMPVFARLGNRLKRIIAYFGRDALDIWVTHLLLLFFYRQYVNFQSGNAAIVFGIIAILIFATILLSSINITNHIRFPLGLAFGGATRFRKRYVIYAVLALILIVLSSGTSGNPYGNFLAAPALTIAKKLPANTKVTLASNYLWYVKHHPVPQTVELIVEAQSGGHNVEINPELVTIQMDKKEVDFSGIAAEDGTLHFTKPVDDFKPGIYTVTALINNSDSTIPSNSVKIYINEPLLVSWTFDWEGWDVTDNALAQITDLRAQYPTIKFTHFVNPRMFLPGVLTADRRVKLISYLNDLHAKGDEIAMHLHMHYDLVQAAGVATREAHWGLRSNEGYDVPTTEYTPQEFRQIVAFAKSLARDSGLPPMKGYRAGGWYLNTDLLNELSGLGFSYDSSGRDRPATGPFSRIPWNLPPGAQPYFPSSQDQNIKADSSSILEIPNNGVSTYDQTIQDLTLRIGTVYKGGILQQPKVLVFTSHPQFYTQEFAKIPEVLKKIAAVSQIAGLGPAVFTTTGDISNLWYKLNQ